MRHYLLFNNKGELACSIGDDKLNIRHPAALIMGLYGLGPLTKGHKLHVFGKDEYGSYDSRWYIASGNGWAQVYPEEWVAVTRNEHGFTDEFMNYVKTIKLLNQYD